MTQIVRFTLETPNERWYELADEIGRYMEDPSTRLVISRQPRNMEDHKIKQAFTKLQEEQAGLQEYDSKEVDGKMLYVFCNHRDVPQACVQVGEKFHCVKLCELTAVVK